MAKFIPFYTLTFLSCLCFFVICNAVYSRVSAQYDWIRNTVCEMSRDPPRWYDCPTPSPVPVTPSPSRSPIPHNKVQLLIDIELDEYPEETGWMLSTLTENDEDGEDASEEVVYAKPIGGYAGSDAGTVLQYRVLVDAEGWYNLTIYDSAGNGFAGTLNVDLDTGVQSESRSLVKEPGFTEVSGNAVNYAMYVGSSPPRFLTLNLLFDDYSASVGGVAYELRNDDDDIIFALAWNETYYSTAGFESVTIPIYGPAGGDRTYTLRFWAGDVLYELYLGDPEADATLLNVGSGAGGTDETFRFVIDGDSPPPMSTPSSSVSKSTASSPPGSSPSAAEGPSLVGDDNDERPTTMDYTPTTADHFNDDILAAENPDTSFTPKSGALLCSCWHVASVAVALGFSISLLMLQ